jgi:predicted membrane protein
MIDICRPTPDEAFSKEAVVMRNQGLVYIAILIIIAGVVLLLGNIFAIDFGAYCFPLGLILLGLFVLLRPRAVAPGTRSSTVLIGDFDRAGPGELSAEEYWGFIVDANFDLTKYDVPPGETIIRGFSFIGEVEIFAPADVGVAINGASFVTTLKIGGEEEETSILSPANWKSDGYKMAERRVRFDLTQFIGDIKLRRF